MQTTKQILTEIINKRGECIANIDYIKENFALGLITPNEYLAQLTDVLNTFENFKVSTLDQNAISPDFLAGFDYAHSLLIIID